MFPALTGGFFTTEPPGKLHRGDVNKAITISKKKQQRREAHLETGGIPRKVFVTRVNE